MKSLTLGEGVRIMANFGNQLLSGRKSMIDHMLLKLKTVEFTVGTADIC